jgi:hypothetical protein
MLPASVDSQEQPPSAYPSIPVQRFLQAVDASTNLNRARMPHLAWQNHFGS